MSDNTNPVITLDETNATVKAVITQIRSDMRASGRYSAYVTEFNVTRETVKDHALALARLVTPETAQKKDGKRTKFGNAVQAAGNGLRAALDKDENKLETDWLRLVKQAAENAQNKGEYSVEAILSAVTETLNGAAEGIQAA